MPNDYTSFEWVGGAPDFNATNATVIRTTSAWHRNYGIRVTATGSGGIAWLAPDASTYNIDIQTGSKWIISAYVAPTTAATRTITFTLKTANGTNYTVSASTSALAGNWTRISGIFDLSSSTDRSARLGISIDSINIGVDVDAVMLEQQVGPLTGPTAYYSPWSNINGRQIPDYTIDTAKFAQSIKPVEIVGVLPTVGNVEGRIVYLTTDNKLYRFDGTVWTAAVPAVDVTGQLTNAQIADIAAAKLTGQITSTQISDNAISTPKLQAGAITTAKIAAGAITAGEIAAGAITTAKLAAGAVTANEIAANAITSDKLTANSVTAGKVAAAAISTTELAAGAVAAGKLAANAIVAGDAVIATGAISSAQIGSLNADKIKTGTIGADTITLGSSSSVIQSNGFVSGSSGFRIRGSGDAEFNNVTVRGSLNAYDLTSGFLPIARLSDGSITDAKIGNLSANKLTAGTINANLIAVTNLNASNITSGSLSADRISGGTINGNAISVINLNASNITSGSLSADRISGGTINAGNISVVNLRADSITVGTINTGQITNGAVTYQATIGMDVNGSNDNDNYWFSCAAGATITVLLNLNAESNGCALASNFTDNQGRNVISSLGGGLYGYLEMSTSMGGFSGKLINTPGGRNVGVAMALQVTADHTGSFYVNVSFATFGSCGNFFGYLSVIQGKR
jgi:hypothetical protein